MSAIRNAPTPNFLDYTALFSRSQAQAILKNDFKDVLPKVNRNRKLRDFNGKSFFEFYRYAYAQLTSNYQNEYWVKNEILKELLIQESRRFNAHISSEFRIGNSKADLAVFNGHATAYEIKTAFDSPERLKTQLADYCKGFHKVYLVVPKSALSKYSSSLDEQTGIITYQENQFEIAKDIESMNPIDKSVAMRSLRTSEYKRIVHLINGALPEMNSFNQFDICSSLIQEIPQKDFEMAYVQVLKERGENKALERGAYKEFNQLALALKWNHIEKKQFIRNLKQPIRI